MTDPADVLHEDADIVAVAKPAGVVVIPARDGPREASLHARLEQTRGERLWVVHRLDRDTSGVLVFARTAQAHRRWSLAFERRDITKTYIAWTLPAPREIEGIIATPLHVARKGKMRPAGPGESGALASETAYRVDYVAQTRAGAVARLQCVPRTGRQHQIRVHLRSIDAPLLVDPLYARRAGLESGALGVRSPSVTRMTLHASRLSAAPPVVSCGELSIEAPLPDDLAALDAWLRTPPV